MVEIVLNGMIWVKLLFFLLPVFSSHFFFFNVAKWVKTFNVRSPTNRWLIQVPRIYSTLRQNGTVSSFQVLLDSLLIILTILFFQLNIFVVPDVFQPLFAVTDDPNTDPDLATFLEEVSGFDSVDDESRVDLRIEKQFVAFHVSLFLSSSFNM
jgi:AMP deaminase